jgi:N-acetylmuramoyl-L-alanine amidase
VIQGLLNKRDPWTQAEIYACIRAMGAGPSLTACIVGEAAREPFDGKLAVGCVVRNRVRDARRWPNSYEEVLCKRAHFSCFNADLFRREIFEIHREKLWWRECYYAAWGIVGDYIGDTTNGATHYWNPDIAAPKWAPKLTWLAKIGDHQFAREGWA